MTQSLFFGTLLFFRELSINRRLEDRLMELETQERIARILIAPVPVAPAPAVSAPHEAAPVPTTETPAETRPVEALVTARVTDFTITCEKQECETRISLMPTSTGTAQGQLLVVLETEVLRIGLAPSGTQVRKRFLLYPGGDARDEFDANSLGTVKGKIFRFSRALQTSAKFTLGTTLKPLAANVYIFDQNHSLIQHERKTFDSDWENP